MEAKAYQYYAKHSVLYDVGETPVGGEKDMPAYQLYVYMKDQKKREALEQKNLLSRWMPVQRNGKYETG